MFDLGNKKILVTGATGNQGGAVARKLLEDGFQVRALTRNTMKESARKLAVLGVEVVYGDLDDRSSLDLVLEDIYGVFAVLTPSEEGVGGEVREGKYLVDACKAAGIKHLVYSSVAGANQKTGIPHFDSKNEIERYIKTAGVPATILRPVFFMYNFNSDYMGIKRKIADEGILSLPLRPDRKLQMLAVDDLAHFVAAAFEYPFDYIGKELDIAGDEMTMTEAAKVFTRVIGGTVRYVEWSAENTWSANQDIMTMYDWFNKVGFHVDIQALKATHPSMMTLETWLHLNGWTDAALEYEWVAA
jgi:uncharacterized protein YbjT (DUF2867 family)